MKPKKNSVPHIISRNSFIPSQSISNNTNDLRYQIPPSSILEYQNICESLESTINDNLPSMSSLNSTRTNNINSNISVVGGAGAGGIYGDLKIHTPMIQIKVNDSIMNEGSNRKNQIALKNNIIKTRFPSPTVQTTYPYDIDKRVLKITNFVPYKDMQEMMNDVTDQMNAKFAGHGALNDLQLGSRKQSSLESLGSGRGSENGSARRQQTQQGSSSRKVVTYQFSKLMLMRNEVIKQKIKNYNTKIKTNCNSQIQTEQNPSYVNTRRVSTTASFRKNIEIVDQINNPIQHYGENKAAKTIEKKKQMLMNHINQSKFEPQVYVQGKGEGHTPQLVKLKFDSPLITMKALNKYIQNRDERYLDASNFQQSQQKGLNLDHFRKVYKDTHQETAQKQKSASKLISNHSRNGGLLPIMTQIPSIVPSPQPPIEYHPLENMQLRLHKYSKLINTENHSTVRINYQIKIHSNGCQSQIKRPKRKNILEILLADKQRE